MREKNRTSLRSICHKDGTVTYWSVYNRTWNERTLNVPDNELAAMSTKERERVVEHLESQRSQD